MNNVTQIDFNIAQLRPYINWLYFYHAWGLAGKPQSDKDKLLGEANAMLDLLQSRYQTHALVGLFDANADGDDIVVGTERMPMLRQQRPSEPGAPYLCLADFVRPLSSGIKDRVGVFAASIDEAIEHDFQGIRPAVGYPSMPDTSLNFIIDRLIDMKRIGIRLTDSGAMKPHASVSGLMFAHPKAHYFDIGRIDDTQLRDYARRRHVPVELMRRFLASRLVD